MVVLALPVIVAVASIAYLLRPLPKELKDSGAVFEDPATGAVFEAPDGTVPERDKSVGDMHEPSMAARRWHRTEKSVHVHVHVHVRMAACVHAPVACMVRCYHACVNMDGLAAVTGRGEWEACQHGGPVYIANTMHAMARCAPAAEVHGVHGHMAHGTWLGAPEQGPMQHTHGTHVQCCCPPMRPP